MDGQKERLHLIYTVRTGFRRLAGLGVASPEPGRGTRCSIVSVEDLGCSGISDVALRGWHRAQESCVDPCIPAYPLLKTSCLPTSQVLSVHMAIRTAPRIPDPDVQLSRAAFSPNILRAMPCTAAGGRRGARAMPGAQDEWLLLLLSALAEACVWPPARCIAMM